MSTILALLVALGVFAVVVVSGVVDWFAYRPDGDDTVRVVHGWSARLLLPAMLGAAVVVISQTIDQEDAIGAIDFNTIGLLAGMMLIVRVTEPTGVYNYMAIRAGQLAKGRPLGVVIAMAGTTAVLSAFLDNLTTILLVVPITFLLADALDIDPIPLILIEIIASNIGGTATLIGDPPNILIAGATGLSFGEFIVTITVDLAAGADSAVIWTNDLTAGYVHENSEYSS